MELPGKMRKGTVGLSHLVCILLLPHHISFFLGCQDKLLSQDFVHRDTFGFARASNNPTGCAS